MSCARVIKFKLNLIKFIKFTATKNFFFNFQNYFLFCSRIIQKKKTQRRQRVPQCRVS